MLQMLDLKGRDPHYSVMTYFVEQLKVSRPDLLNWTDTLTSVPKVAGYSIRAIGAEVDGNYRTVLDDSTDGRSK